MSIVDQLSNVRSFKMKGYIILSTIFIACNLNVAERDVLTVPTETSDAQAIEHTLADSNLVFIRDFPQLPDSSNYFIHYSECALRERKSQSWLKIGSSYGYDDDYNRIIKDLAFQHIDSAALRKLTDRKMLFSNFHVLSRSKTDKSEVIIYNALEHDSNLDGKINNDDFNSVYISKLDGSEFTKLTPDGHHAWMTEYYEGPNILYQISFIDQDSNHRFSDGDTSFISYIRLDNDTFEVIPSEY